MPTLYRPRSSPVPHPTPTPEEIPPTRQFGPLALQPVPPLLCCRSHLTIELAGPERRSRVFLVPVPSSGQGGNKLAAVLFPYRLQRRLRLGRQPCSPSPFLPASAGHPQCARSRVVEGASAPSSTGVSGSGFDSHGSSLPQRCTWYSSPAGKQWPGI